jgi:multidrug efflux pump subunit AcrA (membrane-fusion protein)
MNDVPRASALPAPVQRLERPNDAELRRPATLPVGTPIRTTRGRGRLLGLSGLVLLCGALGIGYSNHYKLNAEVAATAEQRRDFVPSVRTAIVRASGDTMTVSWPGTTEAFEQANIYARASGYISRREVDIGSRVKVGQLLVEITAPELDHQIAKPSARTHSNFKRGTKHIKAWSPPSMG